MHDERYKTIFASLRMVEDLLRGFAARGWADSLDFSSLGKLSAEYVSDDRLRRHGDNVWWVRFRDGRPLLLALEFQSRGDPRIAWRILTYTTLLCQELVRNKAPVLDECIRRGRRRRVLWPRSGGRPARSRCSRFPFSQRSATPRQAADIIYRT